MAHIVTTLNQYGIVKNEIAQVETEIKEATPLLQGKLQALTAQAEALSNTAKESAKYFPITQAHSLKGDTYQLVFVPGKMSAPKLEELARSLGATQEQIDACVGERFWSLTKVK